MTDKTLFDAYRLGDLTLRNRIVMAPLTNNGYDLELATSRLARNDADLFAFGRPFISNPDLIERLKNGAPLTPINPATLYGGGAAGYTDYPTLAQSQAH
jgi:N-ethylmaleimide reductase